MWSYDGYAWPSLHQACIALNLDYDHVITWMLEHKTELLKQPNKALLLYIEHNRYIVDGIIFSNLDAVANYYGICPDKLRCYLNEGYGLEYAANLIRAGLPIDFLKRPPNGTKLPITRIARLRKRGQKSSAKKKGKAKESHDN